MVTRPTTITFGLSLTAIWRSFGAPHSRTALTDTSDPSVCLRRQMATAEPKALRLRARGPSGGAPASLADITSASTFGDLECALRIAFGINESTPIVILSGFPPQQLTLDEHAALGTALPVGELLTVRQGEAGDATVIQGSGAMKKGRGGGSGKATASPGKRKAPSSAASGPGSNIRTLNGPLHKSGGGGAKRAKRGPPLHSEEDLGALLVGAVSKGGGKGRGGQILRAVFRAAVEKQFDEAKANARVVSARMRTYTLTELEDGRTLDGAATRMKVSFPKGMGSRSNHEEVVDVYTKVQLAAMLGQLVGDKNAMEMLKPDNMAGCSPRTFWSMVKHFGDVEGGLRQLMPRQDWSFLHERVRKLSEKAKENLEQEEEAKREREELARLRKEEQEAKKAKREARRQEQQARKGGGSAEEEEEEGKQQQQEEGEEELDPNLFPEEVDEWVTILRNPPIGITNARELANQDGPALAGRLRALGAKGPSEPSDEEVEKWINACQSWELEDIMYELLEGEEAVYDVLVAANMAMPMSVLLWSAAPTAMINTLREEVEAEDLEKVEDRLTPEQIVKWGANAKAMIDRMPWLQDWSTTGHAESTEGDQEG